MRKPQSVPLDLASLLGATSIRQFFGSHWERQLLFVRRGDAHFYAGLPTCSDFEFLLSSLTNPQSGWFSLVKERARPPADSMLTEEGSLNLPEIFAAHQGGSSLLLNQVQKRHRATGVLCRRLEIALSQSNVVLARHIGANAYLSPPDSQGFSIHYDPHDVLVLQLEGHKYWRIYKRLIEFPIAPPADPISPEEAGPRLLELELAPGDLLYLPRGVLHEARTGSESSLHLTLSMETVTWRDLFAEILSIDSRFHETLPQKFLDGSVTESGKRSTLAKLATSLTKGPYMNEARSRVTRRLLANLEPLPNGGFSCIEQSTALKSDTWLGLADGVFGRVDVEPEAAILHLPGASFRADRTMARAFRFLMRTPAFRARDLPVEVEVSEKLKFLQGLVLGGYLVPRSKP